jgi:CDP-diacylglycerol--glycerol-3-phosphate 3-phosphatidyltransferase
MWANARTKIPNALTILRLAAIPVFAWLLLDAGDGAAWGAGIFFAATAFTDQVDGYLARRWHAQTSFGKIADPLADRLLIGVAVVLLWLEGRLPLAGMLLVLARDLVLVLGYKIVAPRGYEFEVSFLGKVATWVLYASVGFVIVTEKGTDWPLVIFWIGVALAVAAALEYVVRARRTLAARAEDAAKAGTDASLPN